ncbi:MAG: class I SAM-dependent methyltransferase [Clostridia bacterium]|nr:class I SAM-dependent methyltransferase [Clostridia bacterium]
MGDDGNDFHRDLIRPCTLRLLNPQQGEHILDACCGNGLFTQYLARMGVSVVGFDYSEVMIDNAKRRCQAYDDRVELYVADATDYEQLISLNNGNGYDNIVANMALMGLPDILPIVKASYDLLPNNGIFVFSVVHPCFQTPGRTFTPDGTGLITYNYINEQKHSYQILADNPKTTFHWHRSLQDLLNVFFDNGFVMDGIEEPVYAEGMCTHSVWTKVPLPAIIRMRKVTIG